AVAPRRQRARRGERARGREAERGAGQAAACRGHPRGRARPRARVRRLPVAKRCERAVTAGSPLGPIRPRKRTSTGEWDGPTPAGAGPQATSIAMAYDAVHTATLLYASYGAVLRRRPARGLLGPRADRGPGPRRRRLSAFTDVSRSSPSRCLCGVPRP